MSSYSCSKEQDEYYINVTSTRHSTTPESEAALRKRFLPLFTATEGHCLPLQDVPCTVVDSCGIIVLWYLPGAITTSRNLKMTVRMHNLDKSFKGSLPEVSKSKSLKWQERGYKATRTTPTSAGHIPFSPCWFNVAHQLSVSGSFRGWPHSPIIQYLHTDLESLFLLSAILAIIHPKLAVRAFSILCAIQNGEITNAAPNSLRPK
ncbi:hypothetical protein BYT27DRAFT_7210077 [Phlegmacium glaucopus]|nr:hypothetical protein BYT27DRAFT_7210077 [Phlegmacium glaucopus]